MNYIIYGSTKIHRLYPFCITRALIAFVSSLARARVCVCVCVCVCRRDGVVLQVALLGAVSCKNQNAADGSA